MVFARSRTFGGAIQTLSQCWTEFSAINQSLILECDIESWRRYFRVCCFGDFVYVLLSFNCKVVGQIHECNAIDRIYPVRVRLTQSYLTPVVSKTEPDIFY